MTGILGIHHVTAVARRPQRNVDFYAGFLGLRLVKRTVNYEDPYAYHLYYGDATGTPGSLLTFFPWGDAPPGRTGSGQVAVTALSILPGSIGFWLERLISRGMKFTGPTVRAGLAAQPERVLAFTDPDGLLLELVADPAAGERPGWTGAPGIPAEHAIRGLYGVTLWVETLEPTERLLVDALGLRPAREVETTRRFVTASGGPGSNVDVRAIGGFGEGADGPGTVHHVAWTVAEEAEQLDLRSRIKGAGLHPTDVLDRSYFRSVYFQEPGRTLFEIATAGPGFLIDESPDRLGGALALPPRFAADRATIEAVLPEVHLPGGPTPDWFDRDTV